MGTPNREPREYSRSVIGRNITTQVDIFRLHSDYGLEFLFGVSSSSPFTRTFNPRPQRPVGLVWPFPTGGTKPIPEFGFCVFWGVAFGFPELGGSAEVQLAYKCILHSKYNHIMPYDEIAILRIKPT